MTTDTDICRLSLGWIGDSTDLVAISPPDGSVAAKHCARFYPIARDAVLAAHTWDFNTTRKLADAGVVPDGVTEWDFVYQLPNNCLEVIAVLPPDAMDDVSAPATTTSVFTGQAIRTTPYPAMYMAQPFKKEALPDGSVVIYTNQENAMIRYTLRVTDTTKFPPLVVIAISRLLSSFLAGPILKGDVGREEAKAQMQFYMAALVDAKAKDANQEHSEVQQAVDWMINR